MGRTRGAKDLKQRKKRKFYAGKKIKRRRRNRGGNLVPYVSKRKRGDPIKVWFWEQTPMSKDGYLRWNRKIRPILKKIVYLFVDKPFFVDPEEISDTEGIGNLAIERIQYPGVFYMMMPTHSKNTFRVSFKRKATIKIVEDGDEELHAKVMNYTPLTRYWFFKN